jgi:predicted nucleic acid-binding protein
MPTRDVASAWKDAIYGMRDLKIIVCEARDLDQAWSYFRRADFHKLSAVDATSFAIMKRARIQLAYSFDHHFAVAGFRMTG